MSNDASVRPGQLILVPAVITLAVTLLRLVGELQDWSPALFSKAPGGGGAPRRDLLARPGLRRLVRLEAGQGRRGTGGDRTRAGPGDPRVRDPARPRALPRTRSGIGPAEHRHARGLRGRLGRGPRRGPPRLARARAHAARLRLRRADPGRARHAGRHPRQLGHALRRPAAGGARDVRRSGSGSVIGRAPADDHLALVHLGGRWDASASWPARSPAAPGPA